MTFHAWLWHRHQTTWLASWLPPSLLHLHHTSLAPFVSDIMWWWFFLCFVELYLFQHLMNWCCKRVWCYFKMLSDLMFWFCFVCLLLVFYKLLEPSTCITLKLNPEICGYDHDAYFHGEFLAPPIHRQWLWWRQQIAYVLKEVQGFHMSDWRNLFRHAVAQQGEGVQQPWMTVRGAANWATKWIF